MKIIATLVLLTTLTDLPQFDELTTFAIKQDSIPSRQRYQLRLASNGSTSGKQWTTLIIHPAKIRSGNEILLPIGFNKNTVRISSGDRLLQVDEDYVFIPDINRIRILDENALTSHYPLKITYERFILSSKP
jgi:hypothetical protein